MGSDRNGPDQEHTKTELAVTNFLIERDPGRTKVCDAARHRLLHSGFLVFFLGCGVLHSTGWASVGGEKRGYTVSVGVDVGETDRQVRSWL